MTEDETLFWTGDPLAATRQMFVDAALGAAWRRCEAALPEGWLLAVRHRWGDTPPDYSAVAVNAKGRLPDWDYTPYWSSGPTPTAALEALAERLEGMK